MSDRTEVLVIEDNPQSRRLTRTILDLEGYEVLEAEDAREALKILEERDPHLILMDIQMPGMDGVALTRHLRRDAGIQIPIIALTAYAMNGDRERFLAAGCDGYVSKPIDPSMLPRIIQTHIQTSVRST